MSLDDLLDDETGDDSGGETQDAEEPSGLMKYVGIKQNYEKFQVEELCPRCGKDHTEKHHYYWRCNNGNCKVTTFISTQYRITKRW